MLFAYEQKTYRIPEDVIGDALNQDEYHDLSIAVMNSRTENFKVIADDSITEQEFDVRCMVEMLSGPTGGHVSNLLARAFQYIRENHDISKWVTDIPPGSMARYLHGETGQGFDVTKHCMVGCEDCRIEGMEYLEDIKRVKEINAKGVVPVDEDLRFMMKFVMKEAGIDLDHLGDDEPKYKVFMRNPDGTVTPMSVDQVAEAIAGTPENLPKPTHDVGRRLN